MEINKKLIKDVIEKTIEFYNGFLDKKITTDYNLEISIYHIEALILLFIEYIDRHFGISMDYNISTIYNIIEDNCIKTINNLINYLNKKVKVSEKWIILNQMLT